MLDSLGTDGKDFERLSKWYLENDPFWAAVFRQVWLWDDWPHRWGRDKGIDLIAETHDGRVFAVQAKNYGLQTSITKADVDTFLSESSRPQIAERLLIATTDLIGANAIEVMRAQEKRVTTCLLQELRASDLVWPSSANELTAVSLALVGPRPHQIEALDAIDAWADTTDCRAQVVMACGTGKSLVGVWAADRLGAQRVLVLAPTLTLIRQTARTWTRHAAIRRRLLLVCGDARRVETEELADGEELGILRTTDPVAIATALARSEPLLIVATYNSSPAVAKAMSGTTAEFDLAIADEAHRCAGLESSSHKTILNEQAIRVRRRLFFTATPTIYGTRDKGRAANRNVKLASMDDQGRFGRVIHRLSFAEATERGLLCPYQVVVIPVSDDEVHQLIKQHRIVTPDGDERLDAASLATQIACARAMRRFGCRRMVAFQPGIDQSQRFSVQFPIAAELLPDDEAPSQALWASHIDGRYMRPAAKAQILDRFRADRPDEYRLLSNVKLLQEGVDVPEIDSIAFIDTKRSQASIIQAIGRSVRPAPGKTRGTIVLPVVLRADEPFSAALARSEHRGIVDVLGALRSHDPEIARSLDSMRFNHAHHDAAAHESGGFAFDAAVEVGAEFADAIGLALAQALGVPGSRSGRRAVTAIQPQVLEPTRPPTDEETFEIGIDLLLQAARFNLLPCVPATVGGFPLDAWWREVKERWTQGRLDIDTRTVVVQCVSWLAADLDAHPAIRRAMVEDTDADLAAQFTAQLRPDGIYVSGPLAALAQDPSLIDEFAIPIGLIHDAVVHAAMTTRQRRTRLMIALVHLAAVVERVSTAFGEDDYASDWRRLAAVDGFVHAISVAQLYGTDAPMPARPWRGDSEPEAYAAGVKAAERHVVPHVRELLPFRFADDGATVLSCRERLQENGQQLDEIGWEIYLLVRARGGDHHHAVNQATDGDPRRRLDVRNDFVKRSPRRYRQAL